MRGSFIKNGEFQSRWLQWFFAKLHLSASKCLLLLITLILLLLRHRMASAAVAYASAAAVTMTPCGGTQASMEGGRWKLGTKLGTIRNAPALCFSVCIASVLSFLLSWAQTTRRKYEKQLVNTDQTRRDRFGYLLSSRDDSLSEAELKFTEETNKCRRRYYECWVQLCSPWKL